MVSAKNQAKRVRAQLSKGESWKRFYRSELVLLVLHFWETAVKAIYEIHTVWDIFKSIITSFLYSGDHYELKEWLARHLPQAPSDFAESWQNGHLLAHLLNNLIPGCYPGIEEIHFNDDLQNIKLALDVLEYHFNIRPETTAEEISSGAKDSKVFDLLLNLKKEFENKENNEKIATQTEDKKDVEKRKISRSNCIAKGTGLMVAYVNRIASFVVYCASISDLDLVIDVRGPENTSCCERITARSPRKKECIKPWKSDGFQDSVKTTTDGLHNERGKKLGNARRVIPLEYEIHFNQINCSFIPIAKGQHKVSLLWRGYHISDSPYTVTIEPGLGAYRKNASPGLKSILRMTKNGGQLIFDAKDGTVKFENLNGKHGCRVVKKRVLKYIVRIAGKDVEVNAESIRHLASCLLRMDYAHQKGHLQRRNSWGFQGDAERKVSFIRQFSINLDDPEPQRAKLNRSLSLIPACSIKLPTRRLSCYECEDIVLKKKLETVTEGTVCDFDNCSDKNLNERSFADWNEHFYTSNLSSDISYKIKTIENNKTSCMNISNGSESIDSINSDFESLSEKKLPDCDIENEADCRGSVSFDHLLNGNDNFKKEYAHQKQRGQVLENYLENYKSGENRQEESKCETNDFDGITNIKIIITESEDKKDSIHIDSTAEGGTYGISCQEKEDSTNVANENTNKSLLISSKVENTDKSIIRSYKSKIPRLITSTGKEMAQKKISNSVREAIPKENYFISRGENKRVKSSKKRKNLFNLSIRNKCRKNIKTAKSKTNQICNSTQRVVFENIYDKRCNDIGNTLLTNNVCDNETNKKTVLLNNRANTTELYPDLNTKENINNRRKRSDSWKVKMLKSKFEGEIESKYTNNESYLGTEIGNNIQKNFPFQKNVLSPIKSSSEKLNPLENSQSVRSSTDSQIELKSNSLMKIDKTAKHDALSSLGQCNFKLFNPRPADSRCGLIRNRIRKLEMGNAKKSQSSSRKDVAPDQVNVKKRIVFWEATYGMKVENSKGEKMKTNDIEAEMSEISQTDPNSDASKVDCNSSTIDLITGESEHLNALNGESQNRQVETNKNIAKQKNEEFKLINSYQWTDFSVNQKRRSSDPGIPISAVDNVTVSDAVLEQDSRTELLTSSNDTNYSWGPSTNDDDSFTNLAQPSTDDEYIDDDIQADSAFWGDMSLLKGFEDTFEFTDVLNYEEKELFKSSPTDVVPNATECKVFGIAAYFGYVSVKNRFQVLTSDAGPGALSASVQGMGRHDVCSVSVDYLRKDVYQVTYQVTTPGLYLVSVRWREEPIPGSPFICRVTF